MSIWYVVTVTGRNSLRWPLYSPTASGGRVVRAVSSRRHCCTEAALLVTMSVSARCAAIAARPTIVLPDPQGSTTTPAPAAANASAAAVW